MILAGFISMLRNEEPGGEVEAAIRLQVADALACLALASPTNEARHLKTFLEGEDAAATAAIIRMSECDAIHIPSCLTPAAVGVPVALAHARDGDSLSRAIRASIALGLWVAQSVGGVKALERGVWPTLLSAPAMAAVAASIAQGLDDDEAANAVSIAIAGTSGRLGRPAGMPSARWLAIAEATSRGVRAASASRAGFRGDATLFGRDWLRAQSGGDLVECEPDADGVARVGLKPYVAARQGMNALAAYETLRAQIDWRDIESIAVELSEECLPVVTRPLVSGDRLSRIANLPWRLATGIVHPADLLDPSAGTGDDPDVAALAARIHVGAAGFERTGSVWPARLRIRAGGRELIAECAKCPGDAGDLDGQRRIVEEKIARLDEGVGAAVRRVMEAEDAEALMRRARKGLDFAFRSFASGREGKAASECAA